MDMEKISDRRRAQLVANLVGYALGVPGQAILEDLRGTQAVAKGRQLAMYMAHIALGWSIARVAAAFERDRSTVAYACQTVEDMRDDDAFDVWASALEDSLQRVEQLVRKAA